MWLLTTANLGEDASQCRAMGIDAYVTKPMRESILLSILAAVLSPPGPEAETGPAAVVSNRSLRILLAETDPVDNVYAATHLKACGNFVRKPDTGPAPRGA